MATKKPSDELETFFFPELGLSVESENLKSATTLAEKQSKESE